MHLRSLKVQRCRLWWVLETIRLEIELTRHLT
jgi:hypothetical protein